MGARFGNPRRRSVTNTRRRLKTHVRTESLPVARRQPARRDKVRDKVRHDVHMLSGAYVAHAVGAHDRAAFEAHLMGCKSCRSEVAALREAAAELARLVETAPPPRLRMRVLAATVRRRRFPFG